MMKRIALGLAALALLVLQVGPSAYAAYNFPATIGQFSGDMTTPSANSYATTVTKFNGGTSFGSMAGQAATGVAITGGAINGTAIGGTTPAAVTGTAITGTSLSAGTGNVSGGAGQFSGALTAAAHVVGLRVVTASGNVTLTATDYIVCINKTTGAATAVAGPATPVTGQIFVVKDCKGDAATNNITFTPASGNVDGAASIVLNQPYQSVNLVYNGTQFNVF